jgi:hypothetical protein
MMLFSLGSLDRPDDKLVHSGHGPDQGFYLARSSTFFKGNDPKKIYGFIIAL